MNLNTLEFYNKKGDNLNLVLNNGIYSGKVYIPPVSCELFENEHIFIYDKIVYNGNALLGKIQNNTTDDILIRSYWKDNTNEYFFIYNTVNDYIQRNKYQEYTIDEINKFVNINNNSKLVTNYNPEPIDVKIAFTSDVEGEYSRILLLEFYNKTTEERIPIAEIEFYCECEGEDIRLNDMLTNLALDFSANESYIFKSYDPSERSIDWKLVNKKRKELLLTSAEIKNYHTSYLGLINILKFYGYNLKVRELWQNINDTTNVNKFKIVEIIDSLDDELRKINNLEQFSIPNKTYKKTNFLQLVYDINKIDEDNYDIENLPLTYENFDYSIEEILLKLYSLKRILTDKHLKLETKIIDIIGEGDYFTKFEIVMNNLSHRIEEYHQNSSISLNVKNGNEGYIEDLREFIFSVEGNNTYPEMHPIHLYPLSTMSEVELDNKFNLLSSSTLVKDNTLNDLINKDNFEYFTNLFLYYFMNKSGQYADNEYTPCGYLTELEIDFNNEITLEYISTTFGQIDPYFTIDNIKYGYYYEVEWDIVKQIDDDSPIQWNYNLRGTVTDFSNIKVILPYTGVYDINIRLYDLHGHTMYNYNQDAITVKSLEIDCIGIYKTPYQEYSFGDNGDLLLKEQFNDVITPYKNQLNLNDANILFKSLNQANYSNINRYKPLDNYIFSNFEDVLIKDLNHLTFDMVEYAKNEDWIHLEDFNYPLDSASLLLFQDLMFTSKIYSDIPTSFPIFNLNNLINLTGFNITEIGNNFHIYSELYGSQIINYGLVDETNIIEVDNFIDYVNNNLNGYQFNPIYNYDLNSDKESLNHIKVIATSLNEMADCTVFYWTSRVGNTPIARPIPVNNGQLIGATKGRSFFVNPTLDEIDIVINRKTFNNYTQILFVADNCNIPGKNSYKWELTNINTNDITYCNEEYFTHLFKQKGEYNLNLILKDTNGNISNKTKYGLIDII